MKTMKAVAVFGSVAMIVGFTLLFRFVADSGVREKEVASGSSESPSQPAKKQKNNSVREDRVDFKSLADSVSSRSRKMSPAAFSKQAYVFYYSTQNYGKALVKKGVYEKEGSYLLRLRAVEDSLQRLIDRRLRDYTSGDSSWWTVTTPVPNIGGYSPDNECAHTLFNTLLGDEIWKFSRIPYATGYMTDENMSPIYKVERRFWEFRTRDDIQVLKSTYCYQVPLQKAQKYDIANSQSNGVVESTFRVILDSTSSQNQTFVLRPYVKHVASRWIISSDTIFHYEDSRFLLQLAKR